MTTRAVAAGAMLALALGTRTWAVEAAPPLFAPVLHLAFDGQAQALAPGATVTVSGAEGLVYGEGRVGQAADFPGRAALDYRPLPSLDPASGTLAFWVRPLHERTEMGDHPYVRFTNDDASAGMEVGFYHVECSVQVTMWAKGRKYRRYGWGWQKDAWQHIAVTWQDGASDNAGLRLYLNGTETGYPATYAAIAPPTSLRVGAGPPPEGASSLAWLDEVTVYNRALEASQVRLLCEASLGTLDERVAAVRERLALDEAERHRLDDLLFSQRRIAMIHGRVQSLVNWPDATFARLGLPVPAKIHETELATTDLSQYHALLVGGGGGLRLDAAGKKALCEYVRNGGGYVGICGGAVSAAEAGLITATRYHFGARGPVFAKLLKHPVTNGFDLSRTLLFPHAGGPLFVLAADSGEIPVVLFDVGGPPLPVFVNAIATSLGQGRVLVFSGHPEDAVQTRPLLRNAVLWTTGITEAAAPAAAMP